MTATVLIVDDSPLTRALIRNALTPEGFNIVGEASNGEDGAALAGRDQPDLVTVDMNMPGLDGADAVRAIRSKAPRSRILLITARHEGLEDMERAGVDLVIFKPFPPEALTRAARTLLGAQAPTAGDPVPAAPPPNPDAWADFKEIGNIGAGNAAAGLADVIRRRCIISLPDVFSLDTPTLLAKLGARDSIVTALLVKISGDIPATILMLLKRQHAHTVVRYSTNAGIDGSGNDFSFTAQFALRQLADTLTTAFTGGVNELLGIKTKRGAGQFIVDMDAALVQKILAGVPVTEVPALAISCDFYDVERSFEGKFVYFLEGPAQETARKKIEGLLKG